MKKQCDHSQPKSIEDRWDTLITVFIVLRVPAYPAAANNSSEKHVSFVTYGTLNIQSMGKERKQTERNTRK